MIIQRDLALGRKLARCMRLGIRYQLLLPLALLLLGVMAASIWSARVAADRAEERVAKQVQSVSHTLANANFPLQKNVLDQMKQLSGAELLLVLPSESRVSTLATANVPLPEETAFQSSGDTGMGLPVTVADLEYRCRRVLLKEPHRNAGGVVYIFYPEALLNEAIADAQRPALLGFLFGLIAVVLTFVVGQRLVSRIAVIQRRTQTIAAGDFSPMPVSTTNDELRDLTVAVNEMVQRLAELQTTVRKTERLRLSSQLAAGLAHQLRNNVTGAKLALQVYLGDHGPDDTEALAVTLRQLTLMESNLRRFIDLGRPTSGKTEVFSLRAMIDDVVELHRPRCRHAAITLTWEPATDARVQGDVNFLNDVLMNLVSNALDAAGPGGTVQITLEQRTSSVVVHIADNGPGPSPEVAARLFEPFVTSKPEGIGLGLAVARHAVAALGGTIDWHHDATQTVFHVVLPTI